jgi:glycosyltransferase involved in cell wall biosynthesis
MHSLIVFSHLRWNFVHQRPQHVLSRLAQHFRVVFVEEPIHADGPPTLDRYSPAPNVEVLTPRTSVHAPGYHDDQLAVLKPLLTEHFKAEPVSECAVWFYTPMALPLLNVVSPRAVVYDCMDELSAFKGAPPELVAREAELMRLADVVFTGGPSLYESKRHRHANVLCLPSAVDANHYSPKRARADEAAMDRADALQGKAPHPRLGFFGVIDERLDIALVEALADADPTWQIVMAGPVVKIDPAHLPQRPNIHWIGQQPYELLPQLVAGWDVCLLPFALNESTKFISPTKTLEYMAAEKPVVSTAVRDVSVLYGEVVCVAQDTEQFIEQCRQELGESLFRRAARIARMQSMVGRYSWDATASTMHQSIEDAIRKSIQKQQDNPRLVATEAANAPVASRPASRVGAASPSRNDGVALAARSALPATSRRASI